ncbi:ATP-binding domain-containing protein [Azoarcus sp. L1K30]|uniref:ATP-binding domain-containing protein n=1 Tax=Azoarcus sp. L1K30 TaxID=2820277 RepID=UPI001B824DC0|nr:ATP-binding domain-containing protein [Azoarcus sp. L1K30]MBR0567687.1 ATP-binding domain-containing protein [Azoarcus sp. L1K30]
MAHIHPEGWRHLPTSGAKGREIATLALLAEGLGDDFSVYHGLHWTRADGPHAVFGEIGFVVLGPGGRIVLIEQQSGFLDESAAGLLRPGKRRNRDISLDLARTADALRARLRPLLDGAEPRLDCLLYCPDYTVRQPGTAGLDPARIVDAPRRARLLDIVRALCGPEADDSGAGDSAQRPALHRFFSDLLELVPDVQALAGQAVALTTRLSGGLAEWARRIRLDPHRLRVTATAGSGKTQLALAAYSDALHAGRRPLYVCYNRPLADHFAHIVPPGGEVATYHQLCDRRLRAAGRTPDFSAPDRFRRMEADFAALLAAGDDDPAWRFDELIVDEGQDFTDAWRDSLLALLKPDGRAWWLEDPLQNLYGRAPVTLTGWAGLSADTNYRTPADVLDLLNARLPLPTPIIAGSPVADSGPEVMRWDDESGLMEATKRAITRAIGLGFRRDMIAIISFRGRESSRFTPLTHLGPHRLRAFRGRYDLFGEAEYSEGDLLIDSVYRFKGQSAACVIFTEIDFEAVDELTMRKLFVGATRATMKVIFVASERAAAVLAQDTD